LNTVLNTLTAPLSSGKLLAHLQGYLSFGLEHICHVLKRRNDWAVKRREPPLLVFKVVKVLIFPYQLSVTVDGFSPQAITSAIISKNNHA
jgi:hypothetical protein